MNTEYGGRITLKLPGGTEMKVHFKDKEKVMRKKRWSQVNLSCLLFFFSEKEKNLQKFNTTIHVVFVKDTCIVGYVMR